MGVGVCGCLCLFPQPPSSHHRGKKLEEGRKRSACRGPHAPPSCPGPQKERAGLEIRSGLILFGFTWRLLRAECSVEEWGIKGHPGSPEGARWIRSGSRAGW